MLSPDTAVLVLGYARPDLLGMVLESINRQGAIGSTHVWIDGTAGRMELRADVEGCAQVARGYPVSDLRKHSGHLGIEKLILDALSELSCQYERIIVLEDDCFPTRDALALFAACLDVIEDRDEIYSVYGHHFLMPSEGDTITRFQGWGWATTRNKLLPVLKQARDLFELTEREYLAFTSACLTPEVVARLDVTPGRDVINVLQQFYSWDSCTSLITAMGGKFHMRTPKRVIYNCGLGGSSGHFADCDFLRMPPFNMIRPDEVWTFF